MGRGKEAVSHFLSRAERGNPSGLDPPQVMLSCGTRIYSLQKLRNTAPKSQTNPKTSPITIETRNNSSGSNSIAKKMNSPGPLGSDSAFLIVQPSALLDATAANSLTPTAAHAGFF